MHRCTDCEEEFVSSHQLKKHSEAQHGPRKYQCDQCPIWYKRPQELNAHKKRAHSNDRPFKRGKCPAEYALAVDLRRHEKKCRGADSRHQKLRDYEAAVAADEVAWSAEHDSDVDEIFFIAADDFIAAQPPVAYVGLQPIHRAIATNEDGVFDAATIEPFIDASKDCNNNGSTDRNQLESSLPTILCQRSGRSSSLPCYLEDDMLDQPLTPDADSAEVETVDDVSLSSGGEAEMSVGSALTASNGLPRTAVPTANRNFVEEQSPSISSCEPDCECSQHSYCFMSSSRKRRATSNVPVARKATRSAAGLTAQQVPEVYGEIRRSRGISRQHAMKLVRKYYSQGEVHVESTKKVSLLCPISKRRIVDACRGEQCLHLECYDLRSYLQYHTQMTYWECPVAGCRKNAPLDRLRIDEYTTSVLQEVPDACLEVEVLADGSFKAVLAKVDFVEVPDECLFEPQGPTTVKEEPVDVVERNTIAM